MKILILDIETAPISAHVWGLFNQNIGITQITEPTTMICFAAKWYGESKIFWYSVDKDGQQGMVEAAHKLLDQADVVMHYNGKRFDVPHLNREFLEAGLAPPAPFQQIDLWQVISKRFRFPSSKLAYVLKALGLTEKEQTGGHELWVKCMAGDAKAWAKMRRYNCQDVRALEPLYDKLLPWIPQHPSWAVFTGKHVCPKCGSDSLQRRGVARTLVSVYQRFQCNNCSSWSRATTRESGIQIREVAANGG